MVTSTNSYKPKIETQFELSDYIGKNQHKLIDLKPNERHFLMSICYTLPSKGSEIERNISALSKSTGRKWDTCHQYWNSLVSYGYLREVNRDDGTTTYHVVRERIAETIEGFAYIEKYSRSTARGAAKKSQEKAKQKQDFKENTVVQSGNTIQQREEEQPI